MLDPQGEAPGEEEGAWSCGLTEILQPPRLSLQAMAPVLSWKRRKMKGISTAILESFCCLLPEDLKLGQAWATGKRKGP